MLPPPTGPAPLYLTAACLITLVLIATYLAATAAT